MLSPCHQVTLSRRHLRLSAPMTSTAAAAKNIPSSAACDTSDMSFDCINNPQYGAARHRRPNPSSIVPNFRTACADFPFKCSFAKRIIQKRECLMNLTTGTDIGFVIGRDKIRRAALSDLTGEWRIG